MKKIAFILALLPLSAMAETDAEKTLNSVLNNVRANCSGISAELSSLKKMAGIGTAVNAVGAVAGAGGVVAGIAKNNVDSKLIRDKVYEIEKSGGNIEAKAALLQKLSKVSVEEWENLHSTIYDELWDLYTADETGNIRGTDDALAARMGSNQTKSDTLGNIRTGLFATNTATSAAGAFLSSKTSIDETLEAKIKACTESVAELQNASTRVRLEDGENANTELLNKSQNILDKCGDYKNVDAGSLNKLAKGGIITGSVGTATGLAATVTSIIGTKNKISDIDAESENAVDEIEKIHDINVASNVLGGVNAATSLTGTILNATQIKKIKEVVTISEGCEEALQ